MTPASDQPCSLNAYSTLGGTSAKIVRVMTPSLSRSRNCIVSMWWLTPVMARRSSLKRHGPRNSCHRINNFHFPPRTDNVASISGGGSLRDVARRQASVIFSILHHKKHPSCAPYIPVDISRPHSLQHGDISMSLAATAPTSRSRVIGLWILKILFGLAFFAAGCAKIYGAEAMVAEVRCGRARPVVPLFHGCLGNRRRYHAGDAEDDGLWRIASRRNLRRCFLCPALRSARRRHSHDRHGIVLLAIAWTRRDQMADALR
jgi:hypothetical protein